MEDIYKLCDKIVNNRILTIEALKLTLSGIAKGGRARYRTEDDIFKTRAQAMNYRAKKYGVKGRVTPIQLRKIWDDNRVCANCGSDKNLTFDHIIPFYKQGTNTPDNIQILCSRCNMEKGVN